MSRVIFQIKKHKSSLTAYLLSWKKTCPSWTRKQAGNKPSKKDSRHVQVRHRRGEPTALTGESSLKLSVSQWEIQSPIPSPWPLYSILSWGPVPLPLDCELMARLSPFCSPLYSHVQAELLAHQGYKRCCMNPHIPIMPVTSTGTQPVARRPPATP